MKKQIVFAMAFVALCLAANGAQARTADTTPANPKMGCPLMGNSPEGSFTQTRSTEFSPRAPAQNHEAPKQIVKGRTNT